MDQILLKVSDCEKHYASTMGQRFLMLQAKSSTAVACPCYVNDTAHLKSRSGGAGQVLSESVHLALNSRETEPTLESIVLDSFPKWDR